MKPASQSRLSALLACACAGATMIFVAACGGGDDCARGSGGEPTIPQLGAASPGTLINCAGLPTSFSHPGITITSVDLMAEGRVTSTMSGVTLVQPAHCLLQGTTEQRTGVDGKPYAIGFEMRLPAHWHGRFFHQVNPGSSLNGAEAPNVCMPMM